mmetsp:Transcript_30548/g.93438  ORF Transcript_30548/g.93438 Transcript_30548/m.93438 type:complete len:157 (+) Transcript_30548:224-694(+)
MTQGSWRYGSQHATAISCAALTICNGEPPLVFHVLRLGSEMMVRLAPLQPPTPFPTGDAKDRLSLPGRPDLSHVRWRYVIGMGCRPEECWLPARIRTRDRRALCSVTVPHVVAVCIARRGRSQHSHVTSAKYAGSLAGRDAQVERIVNITTFDVVL